MFSVKKCKVEVFNVSAYLKLPYSLDSQASIPQTPMFFGMLQTTCISAVRSPAVPKSSKQQCSARCISVTDKFELSVVAGFSYASTKCEDTSIKKIAILVQEE